MRITKDNAFERAKRPLGANATPPFSKLPSFTTALNARQRWLVVDDDRELLSLMKQMLELIADVEIVCYNNSVEALLALQTNPGEFDGVITDYQMPGMNGMELCRRIRLFAPDLTIFLATSEPDVRRDEVLMKGFTGLLRKPFTFAQLKELLAVCETEVFGPVAKKTPVRLAWPANTRLVLDNIAATVKAPYSPWIASF